MTLIDSMNVNPSHPRSLEYRALILSALIAKHSLDNLRTNSSGDSIDFVVLHGLDGSHVDPAFKSVINSDLEFMRKFGILVSRVPSSFDDKVINEKTFLDVTLEKLHIWGLTMYEKVQFLDVDVMPTLPLDCYFDLGLNAFEIGFESPINAGWILAIPHVVDYQELKRLARWRAEQPIFDVAAGYGTPMPQDLLSGTRSVHGQYFTKWTFYGADLEQGTLVHHFEVQDRQYLYDQSGYSCSTRSNSAWTGIDDSSFVAATKPAEDTLTTMQATSVAVHISSKVSTGGSSELLLPHATACAYILAIDSEQLGRIYGNSSELMHDKLDNLINCCADDHSVPQSNLARDDKGARDSMTAAVGYRPDIQLLRFADELLRKAAAAHPPLQLFRPTARFNHFTGAKKPWNFLDLPSAKTMTRSDREKEKLAFKPPADMPPNCGTSAVQRSSRVEWGRRLDFLQLNVNTTNIHRFLASTEPLRFLSEASG